MSDQPPFTPIRSLGRFFRSIREDVTSVYERDPAARSNLSIVLNYAGLHAIWGHRLAHWFWMHKWHLVGRTLAQVTRFFTGIEIHPGAKIGARFFIDHGMGVVIGETAEVGADVTLYHQVTLGGVSLEKGKRHPTLEDNVVVGAGAKILGNITIGKCSRIGANSVVVRSVPPHSVVVGVPGRDLARKDDHTPELPDLDHDNLPDVVSVALSQLLQRVEKLEQHTHLEHDLTPHDSLDGTWIDEEKIM